MTASPSFRGEDANLPVAGSGTRAGQVRGLIALTNDPALIRSLQDLAAGGIDVSVISDLQSFTDELLLRTGDTALIDAVALEQPVGQLVDAISRQLPDLRLMIAGHGTEQQQLGARIENHTVFRFVHKPVSSQRLKLLLDAAARPASSSVVLAPATTADQEPRTRVATTWRGKSPPGLALVGMVVIAALAAAAWVFWPNGGSADSKPDISMASTRPTMAATQIAALLAEADKVFAAGRYVASDGSSAAELYRAALKLDATNRAAGNGYDRARDQALQHAEELLLTGRLNEASAIAAAVALLEPGNSRLGFLNTRISRELARLNTGASQRQAFEARQAQIRAAEAIGVNDPAVGSARETDAARSINSNAAGLDAMLRRVDEATTPQVASDPVKPAPRVETPVTAPAPVPAQAAPAPVEVVATPVTVPTPPATSAPAGTANEIVSARTLRLLRSQDPVYPDWALQQLISGWVEMDFTLATDGSVKDIAVTSAEPRNTFNAAATYALARYRFAPVIRDGAPVTQRAHIRMRFTAQEAK